MTGLILKDAISLGTGAFLGAMSRYQAGRMAAEWIAADPKNLGKYTLWHTAAINVSGSFLLGCISAAPSVEQSPQSPLKGLSPRAKLMMGVGFCGSFTTFSTFSVDVVNWISAGQINRAMAYVLVNNMGGFLAAGLGIAIVKKLF